MNKIDKIVYDMVKRVIDQRVVDKLDERMWRAIQKSQVPARRWVKGEPDDGTT